MENQLVWRIVLNWLFESYEGEPDPPLAEGAEFDPTDIGRELWVALQDALWPKPALPAPTYTDPSWFVAHTLTDEELDALYEP